MKVTLLLPTNKSLKYVFKYLLSESSLLSLEPLFKFNEVNLSVCSQSFCEKDFLEVSPAQFNRVRFSFCQQQTPPNMHLLRQTSALNFPDSEFYIFVDDNIEFKKDAGQRILESLEYMKENTKCGAVQFDGFFGGSKFKKQIVPSKTVYTSTSRGLLIRNVFEGRIFDEEQINLLGGFEDASAGVNLLLKGFYIAKSFNNFTLHHDKLRISYDVRRFIDDNELHELSHVDNNFFNWFENKFGKFKRSFDQYGDVQISSQWNKKIEQIYKDNGGSLEIFQK